MPCVEDDSLSSAGVSYVHCTIGLFSPSYSPCLSLTVCVSLCLCLALCLMSRARVLCTIVATFGSTQLSAQPLLRSAFEPKPFVARARRVI
jgi:hypothetical protein